MYIYKVCKLALDGGNGTFTSRRRPQAQFPVGLDSNQDQKIRNDPSLTSPFTDWTVVVVVVISLYSECMLDYISHFDSYHQQVL